MRTQQELMLLVMLPEMGSFPRMLFVHVLQRVALRIQKDLDIGSCAAHRGVVDHQPAAGCQQLPARRVEEECWSEMVEWLFQVADRPRYWEEAEPRPVIPVALTGD